MKRRSKIISVNDKIFYIENPIDVIKIVQTNELIQ